MWKVCYQIRFTHLEPLEISVPSNLVYEKHLRNALRRVQVIFAST